MSEVSSPSALRGPAQLAAALGGVGSLAMIFMVARPPLVLLLMFIAWVAAPFVGYAFAEPWAGRRSGNSPRSLHGTMIVIAVTSLAIYAIPAFGPVQARPAKYFLVLPMASLIVLTAATLAAGKKQ